MWTLVNASYGIAMGQRPQGPSGIRDHNRRPTPTISPLLSGDARLEAMQARRREHLTHAAHEQWVDAVTTAPSGRHRFGGTLPRFCLRGAVLRYLQRFQRRMQTVSPRVLG